jgi:hypothetical protein
MAVLKGEIHESGAVASGTTILDMDVSSLSIASGDFVVIGIVVGNIFADRDLGSAASGNVSGGVYNKEADLFSNDTRNTNAYVFAGFATGNDTIITIDLGASAALPAFVVRVYTDVDPITPLDATTTTATGINTDASLPPPIAPITNGTLIVPIYFGSQDSVGFGWSAPAGLTNFVFTTNSRGIIGAGDFVWSGSGNAVPSVVTGNEGSVSDSWAGVTLALRPAPTSNINVQWF